SRLTGWDEDRKKPPTARLQIQLDGDRLLPDRAVRAHGQDDVRIELQVGPGRHVQTLGRLPQVPELDAVHTRELCELGIVRDELVEPALDVEPLRDAALQQLAP